MKRLCAVIEGVESGARRLGTRQIQGELWLIEDARCVCPAAAFFDAPSGIAAVAMQKVMIVDVELEA